MPSHKARASIKRLQRQLEFDHPGVRNLPTKSTKRSPTSPTNRTTNEFTWEKQPYFILGTGHYARILAELQGGAPHVTSYLEEAGKVRKLKNVLGSDGNSIERVAQGRRKPVYNYVDFMTRFSSAE